MTTTLINRPRFEYATARLREFEVETSNDLSNRSTVTSVSFAGEPFKASKRFWHSLQLRFGFTPNIFRYFTHAELFQRISQVAPNDELRLCIERPTSGKTGTLLAVTNPSAGVAEFGELERLLEKYDSEGVSYHNGVVSSTHTPRMANPFQIAGDHFQSKYVIDAPIDGFGRPAVYLSLLRQICANGAIAYAAAFRSELAVGRGGDTVTFALQRALEGFNNEEGYVALRERFESATQSWASVQETQRLYKIITKQFHQNGFSTPKAKGGDGGVTLPESSPVFRKFHQMTGDLTRLYGLADLDALTAKKQRSLPAGCRVYDLLNFTSELATHHATPEAARALQGHIGQIISGEYDLEGTAEQYGDWRDFFMEAPSAN